MSLVLASRNEHKLRELRGLLEPYEVAALPDDVTLPPENGTTFEENALTKAQVAARATGISAVADDSGIEAAALGGAPGVRSARFAGENASDGENLDRLLREVPADGDLRVAYICALAYVEPADGRSANARVFEGRCEGTLTHDPRGTGGFGYDPAFVPADRSDGRTMAELSPVEKDAISHRGRAARALLAWLEAREAGS